MSPAPLLIRELGMLIGGPVPEMETIRRLMGRARAAVVSAFRTGPGGTAYGSAVLTAEGDIFTAGQYSSFNHVTNVHAEQGALLLATMADQHDVVALALSSNGSAPPAPCGVCRQVMAEHAQRTGRDFLVVLDAGEGNAPSIQRVGDLLPGAWQAGRTRLPPAQPDLRPLPPAMSSGGPGDAPPPGVGDLVTLVDGHVALVWHPEIQPGLHLVKLKYATRGNGLEKLPHSFSEPLHYLSREHDSGWRSPAWYGGRAVLTSAGDIRTVHRAPSLAELGIMPPSAILEIIVSAGVDAAKVRVTGSRALGIQMAGSDWDLVVPVTKGVPGPLREAMARAVRDGALGIPAASGTWQVAAAFFPGGVEGLVRGGRFVGTFDSGGKSCALMLDGSPASLPGDPGQGWIPLGRGAIHGTVVEAEQAILKRARFDLVDDDGETFRVLSYHKLANMVRPGDRVSCRGWMVRDPSPGGRLGLVQLLRQPDGIEWMGARP